MSSVFRKLLVIGAGAVLLAGLTAGTLSAASSTKKTYSVTVDPSSMPYSTTSVSKEFTLTYLNTTPGGTSTINSVALTAPTGFTIDTSKPYSFIESSGSTAGTMTASPSNITVTNLNPLTYTQSVKLDFWATVDPTTLTCSTAVGTWVTYAWTGANTSGTLFTLPKDSSGNQIYATTTIGTALASGASITVSGVTVTNDSTTDCIPVTINRSGNNVEILKPTVSGLPLTVDVLWDPEPAANPLPPTETNTPLPLHAIPWCSGTVSAPALPNTTDVSCLISESSQIAGSDTVQVHDVVYLLGDYSFQRGT